LDGRPLALAAGFIQSSDKPSLAVIIDQDGRRFLHLRSADGKTTTQKMGENFKSNPTTFAIHDVDQDGLPGLGILITYEKMKILRQVAGQQFEEYDVAPPGGSVEQPWLSTADIDGDGKSGVLTAPKNFLRRGFLHSDADS